jgi:hypothetical protein
MNGRYWDGESSSMEVAERLGEYDRYCGGWADEEPEDEQEQDEEAEE